MVEKVKEKEKLNDGGGVYCVGLAKCVDETRVIKWMLGESI